MCGTLLVNIIIASMLLSGLFPQRSFGGMDTGLPSKEVLLQAQEILDSGKKATENLETYEFQKDYQAIRRNFPSDLEKQYQLLLLREFLSITLQSDFKYQLISGERNLRGVADTIATTGLMPGLRGLAEIYKGEMEERVFDPSNYIESLLVSAIAFQKLFHRQKKDFDHLNRIITGQKKGLVSKTDPKVIEKKARLANEVEIINYWVDQILQANPTHMILIRDPREPNGPIPLYERIQRSYATLIGGGVVGENLIHALRTEFWNEISGRAQGVSKTNHMAAAYAWLHVSRIETKSSEYFLRYHLVRERLWSHLPIDDQRQVFKALDSKLMHDYGFIDEKSKGFHEAAQEILGIMKSHVGHTQGTTPVDGLVKISNIAKEYLKPRAEGITLGLASTLAFRAVTYAFGYTTSIGAGVGLSAKHALAVSNFQEALYFGAFSGLNSFDVARRAVEEGDSPTKVFITGGSVVIGEALLMATFGLVGPLGMLKNLPTIAAGAKIPASIELLAAAPKGTAFPILRNIIYVNRANLANAGMNVAITVLPYPFGARQDSLKALREDGALKFNLISRLLVSSLLGFYSNRLSSVAYLDTLWIYGGANAMVYLVNKIFTGQPIDYEHMVFDFAFMALFNSAKAECLAPLEKYAHTAIQQRYVGYPVAEKALKKMYDISISTFAGGIASSTIYKGLDRNLASGRDQFYSSLRGPFDLPAVPLLPEGN